MCQVDASGMRVKQARISADEVSKVQAGVNDSLMAASTNMSEIYIKGKPTTRRYVDAMSKLQFTN